MATETTAIPDEFLRAIPKTDLHVHLDGSLRLSTLIDLARENGVELPSYEEEELRRTVFKDSYANLGEYLEGFRYTVAVMRTAAALERIAYEFFEDNAREGVRYVESRFAPQLFAGAGGAGDLDIGGVLRAVDAGMRRAAKDFNTALKSDPARAGEPTYAYALIVCGMRDFNEHFSPYYESFCAIHKFEDGKRLQALASVALVTASIAARDEFGLPIVALDIAGPEAGHRAVNHKDAFAIAHKNFLHKTVHAGEAYGAESIYESITSLHADRIGHGLSLFSVDQVTAHEPEAASKFVRDLVEYVADRRIHIEVCLTSNTQTTPELKLSEHPIQQMLANKLSVSLCTDNRLVSHTTVTTEYMLARDTFGAALTPKVLRDMVINGFKRSFFPGSYLEKRRYVRSVIDYYDSLAKEHGLSVE